MKRYLHKTFDWETDEIVHVYDELPLWSAPFGKLLLDNFPIARYNKVLDVTFGAGFPLTDIAQRLGNSCQVYGIDNWSAAVKRTKTKIKTLDITNITIMKTAAIVIFLVLTHSSFHVSAQDKEIIYNIETPDCMAHDTVVQLIAEKSAQFLDGDLEAFNKFVCSLISYPIVASQRRYQGTSYIKFVVNWDGQVKDVSVYKSSGYKILDKEAMRVVKLSPAWTPAKNGDVCVPQQFILPVKFQSLGVIGGN